MSGRGQGASRALQERIAALDALRIARGLTGAEREEADRLHHRLYMREWHRAMAANTRSLEGRGA